MRDAARRVLETLRMPNGLYLASTSDAYHYVWIRDVCYTSLAFLPLEEQAQSDNSQSSHGRYEQTYHSMLDIFDQHRWKLDYHAEHRPQETYEYIHPRYRVESLAEVEEPWGNAQNDAIGAFLYGIGAGLKRGKPMLRHDADRDVIRKLIRYLTTLAYWQDADNGMWEENREVHASSIGACTAGLFAVQPWFPVDWTVIQQGLTSLFALLPRESALKDCDLAQLSLVYPYKLLPRDLAFSVVEQVEKELLRERGVLRYKGDQYYLQEDHEAEWCLGLPWLGLCWLSLGDRSRALSYLSKTEHAMTSPGVLPELYYGTTDQPNPQTPLAWAVSMYIQLFDALARG